MIHSKIGNILEKYIADDEELLNSTKDKFHAIESEIDNMLNKKDADLEAIFRRLKTLLERIFSNIWVSKNWHDIEKDIKKILDLQM